MTFMNDGHKRLIDYIEDLIINEKVKIGDRLPSERELSSILDISRGSVRTGLTVLEAIGVVSNRPGSGNYIAGYFDHNLVQIMTMMYVLDDMSMRDIWGFRYAAELQAVMRAPQNITEGQKKLLKSYVGILINSDDETERTYADKMIHQTIVEASGNRLVIANYLALSKMLDKFVRQVRQSVGRGSAEEYDRFQHTHEELARAVCIGDYDLAKKALDVHQSFVINNIGE